mgnify:CR=1 FL=1
MMVTFQHHVSFMQCVTSVDLWMYVMLVRVWLWKAILSSYWSSPLASANASVCVCWLTSAFFRHPKPLCVALASPIERMSLKDWVLHLLVILPLSLYRHSLPNVCLIWKIPSGDSDHRSDIKWIFFGVVDEKLVRKSLYLMPDQTKFLTLVLFTVCHKW